MRSFRVGDYLTQQKLITLEQYAQILSEQEKPEHAGKSFLETAVTLGFVPEVKTIRKIAAELRIPYMPLENIPIDRDAVFLIPEKTARQYHLIAIGISGRRLITAICDPESFPILDTIGMETGFDIMPVLTESSAIQRTIDEMYDKDYDNKHFPEIFSD